MSAFLNIKKVVGLIDSYYEYSNPFRGKGDLDLNNPERIYRMFARIIPGVRKEIIEESAKKSASHVVNSLNNNAFNVLCELKNEYPVTILTSALDTGVLKVLDEAGQSEGFRVNGSHISYKDGIAQEFSLRNFYDDRGKRLKRIKAANLPNTLVYIGGRIEDDGPCGEVADILVLSPYMTDEYKQAISKEYGNKVRTPGWGEVRKAIMMD